MVAISGLQSRGRCISERSTQKLTCLRHFQKKHIMLLKLEILNLRIWVAKKMTGDFLGNRRCCQWIQDMQLSNSGLPKGPEVVLWQVIKPQKWASAGVHGSLKWNWKIYSMGCTKIWFRDGTCHPANDSFRVLSQQMKIYKNCLSNWRWSLAAENSMLNFICGQSTEETSSLLFVVGENGARTRREAFGSSKNNSTRQT